MSITRGRVVRGAFSPKSEPAAQREIAEIAASPGARRIARAEIAAHARAAEIVEGAQRAAAGVAENAAHEARNAEQAKLAAHYLVLHAAEEHRAERDTDRAISLAILLAERLLGAAIAQDPAHIAALARQALAEARGARRATIEAHPLDAAALRSNLSMVGLPQGTVEVVDNPELSRGSLSLHTDLGTLDAKLTPQLERLAQALRHALEQP